MGYSSTREDAKTESSLSVYPHKRVVYLWLRILIIAAFFLAALSGIWFLGLRPSLQHQAVLQIDRTLNQAEADMGMLLSEDRYRSPQNIVLSEKSLSHALTIHNADISQDWQVTITPANIAATLSFAGCGQNCTFTAILQVNASVENYAQLQVTYAHAQGVLALFLSNDEMTNSVNNNVQIFNRSLLLSKMKMTLLEHAIAVQFH